MLSIRSIGTFAAGLLVLSGVASAAPTAWSQPSGSTDNFNYTGGQSANGNFGDPTIGGDVLLFFPASLTADSTRSTHSSDTVSFLLSPKAGQQFSRISVGLLGDYSINGFGAVDTVGTLKLTNTATNEVITRDVTFTPTMPVTNVSGINQGDFSGTADVSVPKNWMQTLVELNSDLSATATPGSTSLIQLKGASVNLQAAAVPLPAAVLAAPAAMAIGWVARRKMAKKA